jgi:D-alanyl-D-alanine carboxypeptidase
MLELVPLEAHFPTDYPMTPGRSSPGVLHIAACRPIGAKDKRWRLTRANAQRFTRLQDALTARSVEHVRLREAWRDQMIQASYRAGFELWVAAGEPLPHDGRWDRRMRTAYAARPGESYHGCGCAIDIGVRALQMPGVDRGSNAALELFWELAAEYGWSPIIEQPSVNISECWHFESLGPLLAVRTLFQEIGRADARYRGIANGQTARVGNALAGTLVEAAIPGGSVTTAYIQARVTLAGHFCGKIDGIMGPRTLAVLRALNIGSPNAKTKPESLLPELYASQIGRDQLLAL